MIDKFVKLANHLSKSTDLKFYAYDVNLLGLSQRLDLLMVPSLNLQSANNEKSVLLRYKGDLSLELMTQFLKQTGTDPKLKKVLHKGLDQRIEVQKQQEEQAKARESIMEQVEAEMRRRGEL